jgi:hypothetical protein
MDVNLLEKNKRIWLMVENNLPKLVKIKIEYDEKFDMFRIKINKKGAK